MKKVLSVLLTLALVANLTAIVFVNAVATESQQTKVFNFLDSYTAEELAELTADPDDYYVSVFVEFAYPEMDTEGLDELDRPSRNAAIRNYHMMQNLAIATQLGIPADAISSYAPYAELRYESIAAYEAAEDFVYSLGESEDVRDVEIAIANPETHSSNTQGQNTTVYGMTQIRSDLGITDDEYTGDGIKIGFVEESTFSRDCFVDDDLLDQTGGQSSLQDKTNHAFAMTTIAGGYTGIAENAHIYIASLLNLSWRSAIEWLLTQNVDVINISVGDEDGNGRYNQLSSYIDYVINTTDVLVIAAAGEEEEDNQYLSPPAVSANALTVVGITPDKRVIQNSAYRTETPGLVKPDLVAPGSLIYIPGIEQNLGGSSFAAPFATGITARLLEEYPTLKNNAALLKAVLMASCVSVRDQYTYQDQNAGAGLVNYDRARQIMQNQWYGSFDKPYDEVDGAYMLFFELEDTTLGSSIYFRYVIPVPGTSFSNPNQYTNVSLPALSAYRCFMVNTVTQQHTSAVAGSHSGYLPIPMSVMSDMNYIVEVYLEYDAAPSRSETLYYAYIIDRDVQAG